MKRIAILGAGGQAREVAWLIRDINREQPAFEFLGFIVKDLSKLDAHDSREHLLGDESWLQRTGERSIVCPSELALLSCVARSRTT